MTKLSSPVMVSEDKRYHCLKCGDLPPTFFRLWRMNRHYSCGGKIIPIATRCSEPTIIDESDLAPGMVGKVDDADGEWLVTMDVHVDADGHAWALRMDSICDAYGVQYVAGRGRPC